MDSAYHLARWISAFSNFSSEDISFLSSGGRSEFIPLPLAKLFLPLQILHPEVKMENMLHMSLPA